ncbi:MAG: tRNA dihydrouridine(20/20a) synthase DusA [Gammaproteobacteria bacterium]|nr:tRNA dihydrouridine(20/20a) synthase DusA [Gammaproteobacteria bacterium]
MTSVSHINPPDYRFCVAPMMDWTDEHERYFLRLVSARARLYTEMVTTGALIYGDRTRFLAHSEEEHPVALQLGGSEPEDMARCATLGEEAGFDEINMNVGCPSDRVQAGRFGACLMREPSVVARCVEAMSHAVSIPVTVKCRIGVDDDDSFESLCRFVQTIRDAGCQVVIVHARKAWLSGLSPKQNREIPPLHYDRVYALKRSFPQITMVVNGGIRSVAEAHQHLAFVDGVMVGREAYQNPWSLCSVDTELFDQAPRAIARLKRMAKHLLGLFQGQPGARLWRRTLSEQAFRFGAGLEAVEAAEQAVKAVHASQEAIESNAVEGVAP